MTNRQRHILGLARAVTHYVDSDFLDSCLEQFDKRGRLSDKQWDAVERTAQRLQQRLPRAVAFDNADIADTLADI